MLRMTLLNSCHSRDSLARREQREIYGRCGACCCSGPGWRPESHVAVEPRSEQLKELPHQAAQRKPNGTWFSFHHPSGRVARNERGGLRIRFAAEMSTIAQPSPAATASDPPRGMVRNPRQVPFGASWLQHGADRTRFATPVAGWFPLVAPLSPAGSACGLRPLRTRCNRPAPSLASGT